MLLARLRAHVASTDRLLLAAALVTVLPLWTVRYLPFADLPEHLAVIATLRHWTDPAWASSATYELAFTKSQYLAYHLIGAAFAYPLGTELGNRVLLSLVGIALPYSMRAMLRAFGTEERLAILACPLFWSRPLVIGFLPYVAALPVLAYTLALIVRQRRAPTKPRAIAIALLAVLVFYLHVTGYVVLFAVALALAVAMAPSLRAIARSIFDTALVLAPSLLCVLTWSLNAERRGGPQLLGDERAWQERPHVGIGNLFTAWAHDIWVGRIDEIEGVAFWLIVAWLGVQRSATEPDGPRGVLARLTPFACVLFLFVALPYRVGAGSMINVRLAPLLACFALLALRPDPGARTLLAARAGALLSFAVAITAIVQLRASQRELGDFDVILARIRPGTRLLTLHFNSDSEVVQGPAWIHMGSYHRLRRGGVASLSFAEMAHWPIRYRADARPPQKDESFWDFKPCRFRNTVDGEYFDYVLSNGTVDPFGNAPPGPSWKRVALVGQWRLDEKIPGTWQDTGEPDRGPCLP